jgi:TetR/AcrR family transcriptional repressor of nem operon
VNAAIELFRRDGFVAVAVDEICRAAGVTKGAFFHHFASKEALAEACLKEWERRVGAMHETAPYHALEDPLQRLRAAMDYFIQVLSQPQRLASCLAGTTVQEVSETHPRLREAAQACFACGERHIQSLLDDAGRSRGVELDAAALAKLWMATIQGSLILDKASRETSVIAANLRHVKRYIESLFEQDVVDP